MDQYVATESTRLRGRRASTLVTASRKAGERTVCVGLEYSTTTSPASPPNAAAARLLARSLWLPGGTNPPDVCSCPNTAVLQDATSATAISTISRTSRRRR